jgi:aminopeptidase
VYKRGALTLHALRRRLGDGVFFALVRDWVATYRHGSVTTEDFVALAEAHASRAHGDDGRDEVRRLLEAWLWTEPLPPLDARP